MTQEIAVRSRVGTWSLSPKILHWRRGKLDSKGTVYGIQVYGLCGIQGAWGCRSNVSSITLFVFPAGNTALEV